MIYTIFGIYPDNQQRHCDSINADTAAEAEVIYRSENGIDMLIAATIEGEHTPIDGKTYAYE